MADLDTVHRAAITRWSWDDLIVLFLRDMVLVSTVTLGGWAAVLVLDVPSGLRTTIGHLLIAAVILATAVAVARLVGGVVASVALNRSGVAQSATIFVNIAKAIVLGIGTLVLLESLGISITPMLGALGVGGLAVALAMQDTLANLFAGVHILASKKVHTGDYVRLDSGEEGNIIDINWRNTSIRQLPGNVVIVPNARFADAILTNYHQPAQDMSVLVQVGVSYTSDLAQVEQVTLDVARAVMREVEGGVRDHTPLVRFHTFGDSSIDFSVVLRTREFTDQYLIVHEFIKRLHERYRTTGIEIPLPTRNVVMRDRPVGSVGGPELTATVRG